MESPLEKLLNELKKEYPIAYHGIDYDYYLNLEKNKLLINSKIIDRENAKKTIAEDHGFDSWLELIKHLTDSKELTLLNIYIDEVIDFKHVRL